MMTKTIPIITPPRQLVVFKTQERGEGLLTVKKIERGGYLGEYWGNHHKFNLRHLVKDDGVNFYLFTLSNGKVIDGNNKMNVFRKMNHSCEPNVRVVEMHNNRGELGIHFFTKRMIKPGEELTIDYLFRTDDFSPQSLAKYRCLCGSALCRGTMLDLSQPVLK